MNEFQGFVGVLLLRVRDFEGMFRFYRDVLQLPLDESINPGAKYEPRKNWARFQPANGTAIELFEELTFPGNIELPHPRNNSITIAFKVQEITKVYGELKSRGVQFSRPLGEEEWGWYAYFRDPEGNLLQIYEPKPE